ncbi:MAG: hypothetical protein HY698_20860 [Deltaproteobacteria bacterium]|nr:hypothetical protein [Deltaproteobacteria bacterium]
MSPSSRLASLLVRDAIIPVKRMEQAFQRQVIYGGALDTILLEMGVISEDQLAEYMSQATGLPAADRAMLEYFDPRAVQVCPVDLAAEFRVVPITLEGDALRVLVTEPVDLVQLELLATQMGMPVQPFIVPEFRFHLLTERLFGVPTPSRFASLSSKRVTSRPAPEGEDSPATPRKATETLSVDSLARELSRQEERSQVSAEGEGTSERLESAVAAALAPEGRDTIRDLAAQSPWYLAAEIVTASSSPTHAAARGNDENGNATAVDPVAPTQLFQAVTSGYEAPTTQRAEALGQGGGRARTSVDGAHVFDASPLSPKETTEALARAVDRDDVFIALVRGARSRASYASLLTIQGDLALGRLAIDGNSSDATAIAQVAIPLQRGSAFRTASESRSPYIGPIRTGIQETDEVIVKMGGELPPSALILPIVIRDRTVALLYAHARTQPLPPAEVADLLPLASDAALALSKLILRAKKAAAPRMAAAIPVATLPETQDDARVLSAEAPGGGQGPALGPSRRGSPASPAAVTTNATSAQPSIRPKATILFAVPPVPTPGTKPSGPTLSVGKLFDLLESGIEPTASLAMEEALSRGDEMIAELRRRFPGKLLIDRYQVGGRPIPASQHGPVLALAARLGARATQVLVDHLGSEDREIRYYASLACGETHPPIAVPALVSRLFDADFGVRGAALDALLGYPARLLDAALEPVRRALHADPAKTRAAAHALGQLRDVRSIPDLIDVLERDHTTAEEARRGLVQLSKQDFGTRAKKWRAWWEKNRHRSRIEWMLDGLAHSEESVRMSASEELKRLTGEYFGYHYDLPKREREEARQKWLRWWEETGRRRFLGKA